MRRALPKATLQEPVPIDSKITTLLPIRFCLAVRPYRAMPALDVDAWIAQAAVEDTLEVMNATLVAASPKRAPSSRHCWTP